MRRCSLVLDSRRGPRAGPQSSRRLRSQPADLAHTSATGPPAIVFSERLTAALEVLMCSGFPTQLAVIVLLTSMGMRMRLPDGALSGQFIFALTLIDTVLLVGLVFFFLRAHNESRVTMSCSAGGRLGREALFGVLLIPLSFLVVIVVLLIGAGRSLPKLRNVPHNPLQDLAATGWTPRSSRLS